MRPQDVPNDWRDWYFNLTVRVNAGLWGKGKRTVTKRDVTIEHISDTGINYIERPSNVRTAFWDDVIDLQKDRRIPK